MKADVAKRKRGPGDETSYGAEVKEPREGLSGAAGAETYQIVSLLIPDPQH